MKEIDFVRAELGQAGAFRGGESGSRSMAMPARSLDAAWA